MHQIICSESSLDEKTGIGIINYQEHPEFTDEHMDYWFDVEFKEFIEKVTKKHKYL